MKKHYGSKRTTAAATAGGEVHEMPWWSTERLKGIYQVGQTPNKTLGKGTRRRGREFKAPTTHHK